MSATVFLAANFKLFVECAGHRCNDIAAQNAEPLPSLYQFFVRKRSDKFAAFVFVEFTKPD
jgi:hypothetical protein